MSNHRTPIWPYSITAALLAVPIVWIVLLLILALARHFAGWPEPSVSAVLTWAILLAGVIPLVLVVLDFAAAKGVILNFPGVKIDFSRGGPVAAPAMRMPDNIGIPGNVVPDSSPMQIVEALRTAGANEVAVVDLNGGNSWWVTRLLALAAGGERAGRPSMIVFIGREGAVDGRFLGYAPPEAVVRAITGAEEAYGMAYRESKHITFHVRFLAKYAPQGLTANPIVQRYAYDPEYVDLGDAMLEQILMDQLVAIEHQGTPLPGAYPDYPSGPEQPDLLTLNRLRELLAPELINYAIDVEDDPQLGMAEFLRLALPYVALTRNGTYESLIRRESIERLILRQLSSQVQTSGQGAFRA